MQMYYGMVSCCEIIVVVMSIGSHIQKNAVQRKEYSVLTADTDVCQSHVKVRTHNKKCHL
jgi:hypothetical protein